MSEADQLWNALQLQNNEQVIGAVLVAKVKNFDTGTTIISTAVTDDVDWVDQVGIMRAGTLIVERAPIDDE